MNHYKSVTSCVRSEEQHTLVGTICVNGCLYLIAHGSSPASVGEITSTKLWLKAGADPEILLVAGG